MRLRPVIERNEGVEVLEKMIIFQMAKMDEFHQVMEFYYDLIDSFAESEAKPGWIKGIYPTEEMIQTAIENGELLIGIQDGEVVGAMVLNHSYPDEYEKGEWAVQAEKEEVMSIHALGVSAACQGRGVAKRMLACAAGICSGRYAKAIRLDVLGTNLTAKKLYPAAGFHYAGTVKLFYEDTGLADYELYELVL